MMIDNLHLLLGKNKKEVLETLKNNNINIIKKQMLRIFFQITIFNSQFDGVITFFNKKANSVALTYSGDPKYLSNNFDQFIEKLKQYFLEKLGNPVMDNTNHASNHNIIQFNFEKGFLIIDGYISAQNTYLRMMYHINEHFSEEIKPSPKKTLKIRLLTYFIGGFIWGLMMFWSCSNQYNWTNFGIWMGGGLTWAVLFGLGMELFTKLSLNKKPSLKKKGKKLIYFKNFESNKKFDFSYNGVLSIRQQVSAHRIINHLYPCKLYIYENNFDFVYLKKKNLYEKIGTIKMLEDGIDIGNLMIREDNTFFLFILDNPEEYTSIKEYTDEKLGYTSDTFKNIYTAIENVIKEYNPFSLVESPFQDDLNMIIDSLSRAVFRNPKITFEKTKEIILYFFETLNDEYLIKELSEIIYNKIESLEKN